VRGDLERAGNANGCRDSGDSVRPDLLHIWSNPELTLIVVLDHSLRVSDAALPECAQWLEHDQHGHSDVSCQEQTKGSKD
jgi:hypothetical protein